MLFANIMDVWDWLILRPIQKKRKIKNPESKWGDKYYFHRMVDWTREKLFYWLPKRIYKKSGIMIEIVLIIVLILIIGLLGGFTYLF